MRSNARTGAGSSTGEALRGHWPEYLMEAAGLGLFMISACVFGTLLGHPGSPVVQAVPEALVRRVLMGLAMGLTAVCLIYSPWGQRSGAHFNPATTLTFWRLGKVASADAGFYALAQVLGGLAGVSIAATALGPLVAHPSVQYVATVPGSGGTAAAFVSEVIITFILISVVLGISNTTGLARLTPLFVGALVATYIGKLDADTLRAGAPAIAPGWTLDVMARHSLDFWLTSEDLPDPDNRVTLDRQGHIVLDYRPNNEEGHRRLTDKLKQLMKQQTKCGVHGHECHAGLFARSLYRGQRIPLAGVAHQNGTIRFGHDPGTSALDTHCKAHELDNLYVVDGSFFPSSGAVNPALTIIANALRVADHLHTRLA